MRKSGLWLVLLAASVVSARSQITAELRLDQDQFLVGESVLVAVRITNRSGQTLALGNEEDWLNFSVESRDGFVVGKNGDAPVAGEFELESSKTAIKRVDLGPYFSFSVPGRYAITASIKIKNWDRQITSSTVTLNVIQGAKLWEQEFGVPITTAGTNHTPEVRRYMLQQANFTRGRLRLYVRLTDEAGTKTFRVQPIGPLVSFSRVEPQIDRLSNLHVLYADGARTYNYTVISPEGEIVVRQAFEFADSRPHLVANDDGNISVAGGVRRVTSSDVPASSSRSEEKVRPASPPTADDLPKPKP